MGGIWSHVLWVLRGAAFSLSCCTSKQGVHFQGTLDLPIRQVNLAQNPLIPTPAPDPNTNRLRGGGGILSEISHCGIAHFGRKHALPVAPISPHPAPHLLQHLIHLHQGFYGFIFWGGVYFFCCCWALWGNVLCSVLCVRIASIVSYICRCHGNNHC